MAPTEVSRDVIAVLHYLAPLLTAGYFITAKTILQCFLQHPSRHAGTRSRRYTAIALQTFIAITAAAEGISATSQFFGQPGWYASQDYIVYIILLFAVHGSLTLGIVENTKPLWHPYLGAWLVALGFEVPLFALQANAESPKAIADSAADHYATIRMAFCISRDFILLLLIVIMGGFALKDRPKRVKLDDETAALLAQEPNGSIPSVRPLSGLSNRSQSNPSNSRIDSVISVEDSLGSCNDSDGDENNEVDVESDSEEQDQDKELKKQQRKRLEDAGSWLNYFKEFRVFFQMLLPWKDRLVQGCFALIAIIIVAERALNILVPRQLGIVVDALTLAAGTGQVPWHTIGLWILFAVLDSQACLPMIKMLAQIPVQQFGRKAIQTAAFSHIMGLSMDFHNEKDSGELIRAVDQGSSLQNLIDFFLFDVLPMIFDLGVAFVYVAFLFDIYMAIILGGVGVAYVWVGAKGTAWSMKKRRNFNSMWRNESKVQTEAIVGWATVSHFNRGKYEAERYSKTVDAFNAAEWRYFFAAQLGFGAQSTIMLLGRIAAITLAAYRVSQGRAPVGSFVTLVSYWRSIEYPLMNVSYSVRKVSQMLIDSERLLQLLGTKPSVTDTPDAEELDVSSGKVEFDEVDFYYDERKPTLKGINFTVKPGQTVALVGETGGGKSTILKLLYRYYDVIKGSIRIDGQNVRDVTLDSLRDSFGMVPQDPSMFNISIMENIRYARLDATDEEVMEACRSAAIHAKIMSFPDGYKATVGERGVKLSGGEMQRVAIARAILRNPKIVLLDEATSQIDAETEAVIQDAFEELSVNRTTFIIAHRLSTIQHADLILVINDGQIVEHGTHEELFRQKGKYVALWSKQLSRDVQDVGTTLEISREDQSLIELEDEPHSGEETAVSSNEQRPIEFDEMNSEETAVSSSIEPSDVSSQEEGSQ